MKTKNKGKMGGFVRSWKAELKRRKLIVLSHSGKYSGSYDMTHRWLHRHYGKACKCESETCEGKSTYYQWSLLKGKKHDYKRENYWMLCRSCHIKYDYKEETRKKMSLSHLSKHNNTKGRVMRSDGKIYEYLSLAARENGVLPSSIHNVLTGRVKTCGGYTWQRI